ncbi:unnamed protein product [Protopolystoma xenopodis]|uniref:Uncharacterized protein n=1 Tax=Protopolystoma xenopodis TaxID=117903 RepID=A0A448WZ04_9PLAT|nr:unnamed protein product [Protopolystoma xenopodis]
MTSTPLPFLQQLSGASGHLSSQTDAGLPLPDSFSYTPRQADLDAGLPSASLPSTAGGAYNQPANSTPDTTIYTNGQEIAEAMAGLKMVQVRLIHRSFQALDVSLVTGFMACQATFIFFVYN